MNEVEKMVELVAKACQEEFGFPLCLQDWRKVVTYVLMQTGNFAKTKTGTRSPKGEVDPNE